MPETTEKAGAVILSENDRRKIALLYRGKQEDWSFPKGHVDPGENATETLIREIKEETGLEVRILRSLPDLSYIHSTGKIISTKMFLVQSRNDSDLRLEFETDKIEWVPVSEVLSKLTYDNLKQYFVLVQSIIEEAIVSE